MKHIVITIFSVCILFTTNASSIPVLQNGGPGFPSHSNLEWFANSLATMKTKEIRTMLGRPLTLKEWCAVKLVKLSHRNKAVAREGQEPGKLGKRSLTWGIIAIASLLVFFPFSIAAGIVAIKAGNDALKENPEDKDAKTGRTMGIAALITVGALAILLIVAIAAFLNSSWW